MIGRRPIDMTKLVPTSKIALKLSCLNACGNNIGDAEKLYNYIASGLNAIPDVEPVSPTIFQRADELFGWIGNHKDELEQGIALIQGFRQKGGTTNQLAPISGLEPPKNANEI